ncbi:MAG: LptE family protein [Bacteroidales bacterium]|jgi:hypothetical protein|nr:LptE family protein [Bacteroidales bacterium]OPZ98730.1 MAG: hypothetical protein BWY72_00692 [Bacteroidetes bacterium ADurb.Bin416]HBL72925.1 hypothetical protein [Bacteroidales bacterium]
MKRFIHITVLLVMLVVAGCTVQYKFNSASIDYTKVKTISILDFPNQATLVYPPLSQEFTESLKDYFARQTKLKLIPKEGDLNIEGEIVGYELTPMSTQADGYASETKLTVTINVRYTNTTNPDEHFEERFSAFRTFEATRMLDDVQGALTDEICKEIAEQIFNKSVANW